MMLFVHWTVEGNNVGTCMVITQDSQELSKKSHKIATEQNSSILREKH